jgi:TPR repeat protein
MKMLKRIMNNLAVYYDNVEKNYDQSKKYYLMAIDKGNDEAINNLAYCYYCEKKYEQAKKYYLMAIDRGNDSAKLNLAFQYMCIEEKYDIAKQYFFMIEKNACPNNTTIFVNELSRREFDVNFAIKTHKNLNQENINNFNQKITNALL